jgi:hypothetical protein
VIAVLSEAAMLAGFLYLGPLANILGQASPYEVGYLLVLMAIPAVLAADAPQERDGKTQPTDCADSHKYRFGIAVGCDENPAEEGTLQAELLPWDRWRVAPP